LKHIVTKSFKSNCIFVILITKVEAAIDRRTVNKGYSVAIGF